MRKTFILIGVTVIVYILAVNLVSFISSFSFDGSDEMVQREMFIGATTEQADLADSIQLSIERKRWYGKIYETVNSRGKISNLYLLGFVKVPLRSGGSSYVFLHGLFFVVVAVCIVGAVAMKYHRGMRYKRYGY